MNPALLAVTIPAVLLVACIIPPDDREQIRDLVHRRDEALRRGDAAALYRLHDLDFRAICPLAQFRTLPRSAAPVQAIRSVEIRGSRAWATIALAGNGGEERLAFVNDAGRWYLYEETEACLRRSWLLASPRKEPPAPTVRRGIARREPVTIAAVTDG